MECERESGPLLSIVIATRNRFPYALSAIQTLLTISDPGLEIVVQDNSDSRELESHLQAHITDKRLRYRYTPPPLSLIDNFNAAVDLATGEYLCLIGDDDTVNPEIMMAARWAKANQVDALTTPHIVSYLWPGSGIQATLFTRLTGGDLLISGFSGTVCEVDVPREVLRLLHNGGVYYLVFRVPKLYHGLVHRRCLEEIRGRIGAYFQGLSPDIFASLAISQVAKRVVHLDYPLTINGACHGSGSTHSATGGYRKRIEDTSLLRHRENYRWCELVPRVHTAETVWVDSGIAALRALGREDLVQEVNLAKLAAFCVAANRWAAGSVLQGMLAGMRLKGEHAAAGLARFGWSLATGPGQRFVQRAWNRAMILLHRRVFYQQTGLKDLTEASRALTSFLKANDRSFAACVGQPEPSLGELTLTLQGPE